MSVSWVCECLCVSVSVSMFHVLVCVHRVCSGISVDFFSVVVPVRSLCLLGTFVLSGKPIHVQTYIHLAGTSRRVVHRRFFLRILFAIPISIKSEHTQSLPRACRKTHIRTKTTDPQASEPDFFRACCEHNGRETLFGCTCAGLAGIAMRESLLRGAFASSIYVPKSFSLLVRPLSRSFGLVLTSTSSFL